MAKTFGFVLLTALSSLLTLFSPAGAIIPAVSAQAILPEFTAVATGNRHTCALTRGWGLQCWGYNEVGQLGNGQARYYTTPVDLWGVSTFYLPFISK